MSSGVFVKDRSTRWLSQPIERTACLTSLWQPMWNLAIGWVLVIPMLYLAALGTIGVTGPSSTTDAAGGSSGEHKVSIALVTLLFLAVILTRKERLLRSVLDSKLVLCVPLLAILSSAWSAQPLHTALSGTILLIFTVFTICIAAEYGFERQIELIMLAGVVALPLSIALAVLVPSIGSSPTGWRGIFAHKQNCAVVCTLWLVTALHWRCQGFRRRAVKFFYIAMCGVLIIMSQSRIGWLLALLAVLLTGALWAMQRMRLNEALLSVLFLVPAALATAFVAFTQYQHLAVSVGKDATLSQRTIIWAAVWNSIVDHPYLGYGYSAFWNGLNGPSQRVVLIADWGVQQAQNGYLDLWLAVGIGGVALLAVMAAVAMRASIKTLRLKEGGSHSRWCTVVIVLILLLNIGESSFALLQMVWFLFLLAFMGLQSLNRQAGVRKFSANV
jgi:exopolysaccharide production protein ExoQ